MEVREILVRALGLEKDGEAFYSDAAKKSTDEETAKLYSSLAEDERVHARVIERWMNALAEGTDAKDAPELAGIAPLDEKTQVFRVRVDLMEQLPEKATEENALLFAISAEAKSFELYMEGARAAKEERGKDMCLRLAAAERGHFDLLMMRYESRYGYPR